MKFIFPFAFLLLPLIAASQLTDDFNDGDFTNTPAWSGDSSEYIINGFSQLQLNSTGAGLSYLSVSNVLLSLDSTEWHFWIHQNFSPSSSNYGRVYLASDQSNLEGALNGYYLQFGESLSNDAVELFRQTGTTSTSVCRGTNGQIANSFSIGVRVTRNSSGTWNLYVDGSGGTNYIFESSGNDITTNSSSFFGVVCSYTSSNASNFYFDNFYVGPVEVDTIAPVISTLNTTSTTTLDIKYSELVEQSTAEAASNYSVDHGIGIPVTATRDASDFSMVHLSFASSFASGVTNTITINNVTDLSGNPIAANSSAAFAYYLVEPPSASDIILNEVLFNARTGGAEFVELYNNSEKIIDLKDLQFTREDLTTHLPDAPVRLTTATRLLLPGQYIVLTKDSANVKNQYATPPGVFLQMSLPDLLTSEDILILQSLTSSTIDNLHYYEEWQFPLLNSFDGVSLERISFNQPTQLQSNWHSAAESAGFATPGYRNSQHVENENDGSEVKITPEVFSPDDDGKDDVMSLYYSFSEPGFVANAVVYDSRGREIKKIAENVLLGTSGSIQWDGITETREKARTGIYVVYLEVFNTGGDVKKYKRACVVASKL